MALNVPVHELHRQLYLQLNDNTEPRSAKEALGSTNALLNRLETGDLSSRKPDATHLAATLSWLSRWTGRAETTDVDQPVLFHHLQRSAWEVQQLDEVLLSSKGELEGSRWESHAFGYPRAKAHPGGDEAERTGFRGPHFWAHGDDREGQGRGKPTLWRVREATLDDAFRSAPPESDPLYRPEASGHPLTASWWRSIATLVNEAQLSEAQLERYDEVFVDIGHRGPPTSTDDHLGRRFGQVKTPEFARPVFAPADPYMLFRAAERLGQRHGAAPGFPARGLLLTSRISDLFYPFAMLSGLWLDGAESVDFVHPFRDLLATLRSHSVSASWSELRPWLSAEKDWLKAQKHREMQRFAKLDAGGFGFPETPVSWTLLPLPADVLEHPGSWTLDQGFSALFFMGEDPTTRRAVIVDVIAAYGNYYALAEQARLSARVTKNGPTGPFPREIQDSVDRVARNAPAAFSVRHERAPALAEARLLPLSWRPTVADQTPIDLLFGLRHRGPGVGVMLMGPISAGKTTALMAATTLLTKLREPIRTPEEEQPELSGRGLRVATYCNLGEVRHESAWRTGATASGGALALAFVSWLTESATLSPKVPLELIHDGALMLLLDDLYMFTRENELSLDELLDILRALQALVALGNVVVVSFRYSLVHHIGRFVVDPDAQELPPEAGQGTAPGSGEALLVSPAVISKELLQDPRALMEVGLNDLPDRERHGAEALKALKLCLRARGDQTDISSWRAVLLRPWGQEELARLDDWRQPEGSGGDRSETANDTCLSWHLPDHTGEPPQRWRSTHKDWRIQELIRWGHALQTGLVSWLQVHDVASDGAPWRVRIIPPQLFTALHRFLETDADPSSTQRVRNLFKALEATYLAGKDKSRPPQLRDEEARTLAELLVYASRTPELQLVHEPTSSLAAFHVPTDAAKDHHNREACVRDIALSVGLLALSMGRSWSEQTNHEAWIAGGEGQVPRIMTHRMEATTVLRILGSIPITDPHWRRPSGRRINTGASKEREIAAAWRALFDFWKLERPHVRFVEDSTGPLPLVEQPRSVLAELLHNLLVGWLTDEHGRLYSNYMLQVYARYALLRLREGAVPSSAAREGMQLTSESFEDVDLLPLLSGATAWMLAPRVSGADSGSVMESVRGYDNGLIRGLLLQEYALSTGGAAVECRDADLADLLLPAARSALPMSLGRPGLHLDTAGRLTLRFELTAALRRDQLRSRIRGGRWRSGRVALTRSAESPPLANHRVDLSTLETSGFVIELQGVQELRMSGCDLSRHEAGRPALPRGTSAGIVADSALTALRINSCRMLDVTLEVGPLEELILEGDVGTWSLLSLLSLRRAAGVLSTPRPEDAGSGVKVTGDMKNLAKLPLFPLAEEDDAVAWVWDPKEAEALGGWGEFLIDVLAMQELDAAQSPESIAGWVRDAVLRLRGDADGTEELLLSPSDKMFEGRSLELELSPCTRARRLRVYDPQTPSAFELGRGEALAVLLDGSARA
ncbi:MAG: hypothetical protein H6740_12510 [Alphaproteobacteria bacterium]|nr:hypothetical protein [Alphaproteobacteria bacterium]